MAYSYGLCRLSWVGLDSLWGRSWIFLGAYVGGLKPRLGRLAPLSMPLYVVFAALGASLDGFLFLFIIILITRSRLKQMNIEAVSALHIAELCSEH